MADYKTPGVYIQSNAFSYSAIAVATAIPVFIGYTENASFNNVNLIGKPTRITSFAEYIERFGPNPNKPYKPQFFISKTTTAGLQPTSDDVFTYNGLSWHVPKSGISPFDVLKKEFEPTLIVIPDAIALGTVAYHTIYIAVLQHCAEMQSCFAILDLVKQSSSDTTDAIVKDFRDNIGNNNLNYGAAYYPWLKTAIAGPEEVDISNIVLKDVTIAEILPEAGITNLLGNSQALKAASPTYIALMEFLRAQINKLPPSGAMAGIYSMVDNNHGVWKTPANVSLKSADAPTVDVSNDQQQGLNVDELSGKSINVIRFFPGVGNLVWGARTLDGNSQDWRYINVRRTMIMIEQSLKLAARAYVFEPNDSSTWITIKSIIVNFLTTLWKEGALAGAVPEQAFDVQIGLGTTMTGNDILDGKMLIAIKVAIVRPGEFIVITFQQQMQKS